MFTDYMQIPEPGPQALIQLFWRAAQESVFLISCPDDFDTVLCGLDFEMT